MELPQPRALGTGGGKATHDFLSLCSHSSPQQDPNQSCQGGYLKTHDFLQPLERVGKVCAKKETSFDVSTSTAEQAVAPSAHNSSLKHLLPGGIGTYSISHISYFNQRTPKPEGSSVFSVAQPTDTDRNDDNSLCSSLSGSGFMLWEESAAQKGKTRKENMGEKSGSKELPAKIDNWAVSKELPSQSSSSNHRNSYSSLSSSHHSGQKNQTFAEMLKSAVNVNSKDEEVDEGEVFGIKKETSSTAYQGELRIDVNGKSSDHQKANTPRSKHSATEQRRRSKINDRFQKLRELIPRSDQKRDKASFLLEVVEYIQFLQEKVHKYEGSHQGWYREPAKLIPPKNNSNLAECCIDQPRGINNSPGFIFAAKSSENKMPDSPAFPDYLHNPVEFEISNATIFKEADHRPGATNKAIPYPTLRPQQFTPVKNEGAVPKLQSPLSYDTENKPCPEQPALRGTRSCTADVAAVSNELKEPEQIVEGGRISISSAYSQGLLNIIAQALQSSGVDMSQASIAVQIELGKRTSREAAPAVMDAVLCPSDQGIIHGRTGAAKEMEQTFKKKQKT